MSPKISLWDKIRAFFGGPIYIEAKDDDPASDDVNEDEEYRGQ